MREKNLSTSGSASVVYLSLVAGFIALSLATSLFETTTSLVETANTATKNMIDHKRNLEFESARLLSVVNAHTSNL